MPKPHRDTMEAILVFLKWVASFTQMDSRDEQLDHPLFLMFRNQVLMIPKLHHHHLAPPFFQRLSIHGVPACMRDLLRF